MILFFIVFPLLHLVYSEAQSHSAEYIVIELQNIMIFMQRLGLRFEALEMRYTSKIDEHEDG